MKITRFMQTMFSAVENGDEELTKQVANDIESAKANGIVDTKEVKYENRGDGKVAITDKETGEVTIAERAADEAEMYELVPECATPDAQLEGYLHPLDGEGHKGNQTGAPDEHESDHFEGNIAPNLPNGGRNDAAGHERSVEEIAQGCPKCGKNPCECEDEKEFSVSTDNTVVLRIFSDQEFCERVFSEVIESEETAKVGDLKIEKIADEEEAVVVTDENSGDQAKVTFEGDEMKVTELDSKNFSEEEQFDSLHVVGVDAGNHVIVDAPEYDEESAEELKRRLTEDGVDAVEIFDDKEEARDYAFQLLGNLGGDLDGVGEPEQAEYSDHTIWLTEFSTDNTVIMDRMFSETVNGIADLQDAVNDAIHSGDQIETDDEVITPVDACTAVIEDKSNDEITKASIDGNDLKLVRISEEDAQDMTGDLTVIEAESDEDEKDFSEEEEYTDYMVRLFSEEADKEEIESAIKEGEQVETDDEIITPVDSKTAVIEDKNNGEFTKAVVTEDSINVSPISEEKADELTEDLSVEEDEKDYSDIYYDEETETKFFSENEEMTDYMIRLFSDESEVSAIEDAIENGDQIECDNEIITPIDSKAAVVEDKENGEFTKVTLTADGEGINVHPISEEEAENLTEDIEVDEEGVDEHDFSDIVVNEDETKFFSENEEMTDYMIRLFSDEADEKAIEDAIENGDEIETDNEIITPVSSTVAVVEDKENGEFTKATLSDDDIDLEPISEEKANELTEDIEKDEEGTDEETGEKKFSGVYSEDPVLDKWFADVAMAQAAPAGPQTPAAPVAGTNAYGNPVPAAEVPVEGAPTVEAVEDQAQAAVAQIQAAAEAAQAAIMEAKAAPAPNQEADLQEAQFSETEENEIEEKSFSEPFMSWLDDIKY